MNTNKSMVYLLPIRCVIFVLIFVMGAIITKQKVEDISNWWSIAASIVNIAILPITTALAEDGLYLGCGVNQIQNKILAITIPAFFFALQHSFIPTLFDLRFIIYRFISFLPLTVILCWYYYKKRNPLPIMVGHAIIDVATVLQILATSVIPGFYEMMCGM